MPVLADFHYGPAPGFVVPRKFFQFFAVSWDTTTLALCGNPLRVYQPSSGFSLTVRIRDWIWEFSNKSFEMEELFEDFYLSPPPLGSPPCCPVLWDCTWQWDSFTGLAGIAVQARPDPSHEFHYVTTPPPPPDYWDTLIDSGYPACFSHSFP